MKKAGVIISLFLNVFLLVGIAVTHNYDTKNCKAADGGDVKPEPEKAKQIICDKEDPSMVLASDVSKTFSRVIIDYDDDYAITRVRTGAVVEYKEAESYQAALKDNTSTIDLGNNTVFFFKEGENKFTDESGQSFDIWVKTYVDATVQEGFKCE